MKSTGIVRKVDSLGRIVVPIELRRVMGIDVKDPIEIFTDGNKIILGKYEPGCALCGAQEKDMKAIGTLRLCRICAATAGALYK